MNNSISNNASSISSLNTKITSNSNSISSLSNSITSLSNRITTLESSTNSIFSSLPINAIPVTIDNTVYPFMCTYNDGSTIFFLSTRYYSSNSNYTDSFDVTFTFNNKSYTTKAYVPTINDINFYTIPSSRARSYTYRTQSERDSSNTFVIQRVDGNITYGKDTNAYIYLVIKISV